MPQLLVSMIGEGNMKDSILRKIQVVASFSLLMGVPAMSAASHQSFDASDGTLRVSYSDLDLNSDAGIDVLYQRLQKVSQMACDTGTLHQKGSVKATMAAMSCYDKMLSRVVAKVGNAKLTAKHNG